MPNTPPINAPMTFPIAGPQLRELSRLFTMFDRRGVAPVMNVNGHGRIALTTEAFSHMQTWYISPGGNVTFEVRPK